MNKTHSTNKDAIIEAYETILDKRGGFGTYHKCLFHIHTPASYDFCFYKCEKNNPKRYSEMDEHEVFNVASAFGVFHKQVFHSENDLKLDNHFSDKKEYFTYFLNSLSENIPTFSSATTLAL